MPADFVNLTEAGKPAPKPTRLKLYYLNEDGTFAEKFVPYGSSTITYDYLKDFGKGWFTELLFQRIQRLVGPLKKTVPVTPPEIQERVNAALQSPPEISNTPRAGRGRPMLKTEDE